MIELWPLRKVMKKFVLIPVCLLFLAATEAMATQAVHLDSMNNPAGCAGCHRGHGKRGTSMLVTDKQDICFHCHGLTDPNNGSRARNDMYTVFQKRYRHPVLETGMYHSAVEELPEKSPVTPRHAACQDCHSVHMSEVSNPTKGARGYKKGRTRSEEAKEEYELCYRCHSESANLPVDEKNKEDEFDLANPSYHPVEGRGRNTTVRSLRPPYDVSSRISCSDCHGNNDPFGPKGPHGSDYEFILKKQYVMTEAAEGPNTYELCYACHDRQSILRNESFQKHNEHVVFNYTPCAACHNPHGSRTNQHLIDFDNRFVARSPMPSYMPSPTGRPMCMLTCHVGGRDIVHDNAFYTSKKWP